MMRGSASSTSRSLRDSSLYRALALSILVAVVLTAVSSLVGLAASQGTSFLRKLLDEGLVAYYSFDHCSLADFSGHGHNLYVLTKPPTCIKGVAGEAMFFDGRAALISREFPWSTNQFTIAVWLNPLEPYVNVDGGKWFSPVTRGKPTSNYIDPRLHAFTLQLRVISSHDGVFIVRPHVRVTGYNGYFMGDLYYYLRLSGGKWHFVAISYDGNTGRVIIFLDGKVVVDTNLGKYNLSREPLPLLIGYDPQGKVEYLIGALDEIMVFDKALSPKQLSEIYHYYLEHHSEHSGSSAAGTAKTSTATGSQKKAETVTVTLSTVITKEVKVGGNSNLTTAVVIAVAIVVAVVLAKKM